jgi:predicted nucleotidyltransferase
MIIESAHLEVVKSILQKLIPTYEVWAFGSRVHEKNIKKFSDLDLAIIAPNELNLDELIKLKEAFSESDLPFKVDIVDWHSTSEEFQKIILRDYIVLQKVT